MMSKTTHSQYTGLSKPFVQKLRTLFDLLDEEKTGYIKVSDITERWRADSVPGLPIGVIEALHNAETADKKLTFERFVVGLKSAIISDKNQFNTVSGAQISDLFQNRIDSPSRNETIKTTQRSSSANHMAYYEQPAIHTNITRDIKIRENTAPSQSTLFQSSDQTRALHAQKDSMIPDTDIQPFGDEVPERFKTNRRPGSAESAFELSTVLGNMSDNRHLDVNRSSIASTTALENLGKRASGHSARTMKPSREIVDGSRSPAGNKARRHHTVSNGVNYNLIRRMKLLEEEKDILVQGLEVIEHYREWYQRQIKSLYDKQRHLAQAKAVEDLKDYSFELHQERIAAQASRISQANVHLKTLMDSLPSKHSSISGSQTKLDAAVNSGTARDGGSSGTVRDNGGNGTPQELRKHYRHLEEELGEKDKVIERLEREKSELIRDVFAVRSRNANTSRDVDSNTTFL